MTPLLWISAALIVGLGVYALGHYVSAAVFLLTRRQELPDSEVPEAAVSVLVPARNEGAAVVRAIDSLLAQDHRGPVEISVLLDDRSDSCMPFLAARFPTAGLAEDGAACVQLLHSTDRQVTVAFTGEEAKSDKLNWMVPRLSTPYTAILDADHQAHADWLRTSISLLRHQGGRMVQGRRSSLSARRLFQLWDALHQHIGCELFNAAFSRLGLTVFFTGTTVVVTTALLREHPFRRCLTEDAEFSYQVVLDGERILHNAHSGSDEELSPDLFSFLARRRRWANGHTEAFARHLPRLGAAPVTAFGRLQFIFHGLHYLVCVPVFALHAIIGVILLMPLSGTTALLALLTSLIAAAAIVRNQRTAGIGAQLAELAVVHAWVFPAVVIGVSLVRAFADGDATTAALPLASALQLLGLIGFAAPLVVLLVGLAGFRQLSLTTLLVVVLTYPVTFYLDVAAVLLGLLDLVAGRRQWRVVRRQAVAGAPSPVTQLAALDIETSWRLATLFGPLGRAAARRAAPWTRPTRWAGAAVLLAFGAGGLFCTQTRIEVTDADCEVLEHDGNPSIVPPEKMQHYCGPAGSGRNVASASRSGSFVPVRHDPFAPLDAGYWDRLDTTFDCNLAAFDPDNVVRRPDGGLRLELEEQARHGKSFSAASIATKDVASAKFLYGRFETVMKPAKVSGVISAFFLYRFDPWQEIDAEFLGRDTTKLLVNVYYNPGEEGDLYNYGFAGTPVLIDLGFDAAEALHRYAIEWDPHGIRWFVDDRLVHSRPAGRPTPVPHLPMRFHMNVWPTCGESLAGPFASGALPVAAEVASVTLSDWHPSRLSRINDFFASLFSTDEDPSAWREQAEWVQPGR